MNRRHMTGDHHGQAAGRATLLARAMDEILGTQAWIDNDRRLRELLARLEALGAAASKPTRAGTAGTGPPPPKPDTSPHNTVASPLNLWAAGDNGRFAQLRPYMRTSPRSEAVSEVSWRAAGHDADPSSMIYVSCTSHLRETYRFMAPWH